MLLLSIALYLLGTIAIGWWASRKVKTTADFVVAGKNLPMFVAACALFATWFGSETVMGASSQFVEHGLYGVIEDPFGAALCLFLVGLLIARPLYRLNILTFGDYYRHRYNRKAEVIASIFMIPSYFGWIAAQLVALAIILNVLASVPLSVGIIICATVVTIYTYIGGMWAVSITDFVQTIIIIVGLFLLTADVVLKAGGIIQLTNQLPTGFFRILPEKFTLTETLKYIAAWITIGLGSLPQQDVFQRVMAANSEKNAVYAAYLSSLMYLSIAFMPLLIGLCAKVLYPELLKGDVQMVIPNMVLQHNSLFMQILFFGALLSAILSTTSGAVLAPATVIGENLIRPYFKQLTDEQVLMVMRASVVLISIISAALAMMRSNIYELVGESSALSLVALFTPLLAGLYWKKASNFGAISSMIAGLAVWLIFQWIKSDIPSLIWGFGASILAMIIGSYWKPNSTKNDLND